jgi:Mg/Co/Ni transporter MgtE
MQVLHPFDLIGCLEVAAEKEDGQISDVLMQTQYLTVQKDKTFDQMLAEIKSAYLLSNTVNYLAAAMFADDHTQLNVLPICLWDYPTDKSEKKVTELVSKRATTDFLPYLNWVMHDLKSLNATHA